ncbi:hypothetical protein NESM_000156200 [Novymonas esmeraldas]|uniref:DUF1648 domain-containing protein n=1 Tax=Novymonas esmeraldas TaxID=1808958 RepID=A0AAW0F6X2_9TRYP
MWRQRAVWAVAGAEATLSVAHYLVKARSIAGPVPVHFNVFGVPDRTAAPWAFILYPAMSAVLTFAVAHTASVPGADGAAPCSSLEHVATLASLVCGEVVVLVCQYYAARISEGKAARLSPPMMGVLYATLGAAAVAVLTTKTTTRTSRTP